MCRGALIYFSNLEDFFSAVKPHLIQKNPPELTEQNFEMVFNYENLEVLRKVGIFMFGEPREFLELLQFRDFITRIEFIIYRIQNNDEVVFDEYFDKEWCANPENAVFTEVKEFFKLIKNPILRSFVEASYYEYAPNRNFLYFNVGLERKFLAYLFEYVKSFDKENHDVFFRIIGEFLEIEIIIWSLRMHLKYGMKYEEIILLIPHFNIFLKDEEFNNLISVGSVLEAYELLEKSYYSKFFKDPVFPEQSLSNLFMEFDYKLKREMYGYFNDNPFCYGPILSYYILKRFEVVKLISICEGIKLDYDKEKLKELVQ